MKKIVLALLAVSIGSMMAFAGDSQQILTFAEAMGFTRYEMSDMKHSGSVRYVAWSPDGHRLAFVNRDKTVKIWNAESEQYAHYRKPDGLSSGLHAVFQ